MSVSCFMWVGITHAIMILAACYKLQTLILDDIPVTQKTEWILYTAHAEIDKTIQFCTVEIWYSNFITLQGRSLTVTA
jgi:hypothetical protein